MFVQDEWSRKGATLTDKTARKEFGLTRAKLARVDCDLKKLRSEVTALEEHRARLLPDLKA